MDREILFKGERFDNRGWIEGYFAQQKGKCYICTNPYQIMDGYSSKSGQHYGFGDFYEIDPGTICQYTGLNDKNGRKIFEGDIIQFEDTGEEGYEYKEAFDFTNKAKVVWNKGRFELDSFWNNNSGVMETMNDCPDEFYDMFEYYSEVIGNIFDNPELIGSD